jgi:hypothetical protein
MRKELDPRMIKGQGNIFTDLNSYRKNLKFRELIKKEVDSIIPGTPTQDYILLKSQELHNNDNKGLETICFEVAKLGPAVKNENIKVGGWIQIDPGSRMKLLNWGNMYYFMVREFEVSFIFDRNPEKFEMDLYKDYDLVLQAEYDAKNQPVAAIN